MPVSLVAFTPEDLAPLLAALAPTGWVNLWPDVEVDDQRTASGFFGVFGARGPAVPMCTWVPGEHSAGIEHGVGQKAARRIDLPTGWRVTQDHPRRGLVIEVANDATAEEVLRWLVRTGEALCPLPRLGGWTAEVHG